MVAGLGNGVAISALLLAGVAAGEAAAGAWAAMGAYLAAFTNKGGARRPRTRGLLVAAVADAAVFAAGAATAALFPLTLVLLAVLVFLAAAGSRIHPVLERLGTMPATALLVAAGGAAADGARPQTSVLVLLGGLWYAAATAVLTPPARVRDVLAVLAQPYRLIGRSLSVLAASSAGVFAVGTARAHPAAALRRAEEAARELRGPRGSERLAELADPLVERAATLADLAIALAATGPPPAAVRTPCTTAIRSAGQHLLRLADTLTRRPTTGTGGAGGVGGGAGGAGGGAGDTGGGTRGGAGDTGGGTRGGAGDTGGGASGELETALAALEAACDRMRAQVAAGTQAYADSARAGRQRRLLARITTAITAAQQDARALAELAAIRLPAPAPAPAATHPAQPPASAAAPPTESASRWAALWRGIPGIRTVAALPAGTVRHALRTTTVSSAVFLLTQAVALSHGEWATLAVLRVLRPQYAATRERVAQRVIGNVVGGGCAAVLVAVVHEPTALSLILFALITAGFALRPVNYAFWVVFGTPLVLLIGDVSHPGDWSDAAVRIAMTVLGTGAALLGSRLLWPSWEHARLATHTARAVAGTTAYLDTVLGLLPGRSVRPDTAGARRAAEEALAQAHTACRNAHREPGHDPAALDDAVRLLQTLERLIVLSAALTTHRTPCTARIPALALYADHAPAALTGSAGQAVRHLDALADALEEMSLYLDGLHTRRQRELAAGHAGESRLRAAIRDDGPVIELLAAIAAALGEAHTHPQPSPH
ncbi:FUSC family protein [Streptomyces sp. SP2-10]|uniref:FUSC family protein n=1 Tax=Streptomyces sp. SP2-10 TaxID=2873385 RepID=UPI001CA7404E|nr:FUSC family protein [Streptomyces sp. SP2-10]MBY8842902.1 FUSC family protein [Streptomyces sp. SP2-10]